MFRKSMRFVARAIAAALAVGGLALAVPASAQFSDGYKFLEAVKKRDGDAVMKALSEPGTTIINSRDISDGTSALHIVVARRDVVWVQFLLQKGANPNLRDNSGVTPLELATSLRLYDAVEELVKAGATVDETNSTGETPLITATHLRDGELAKILLEHGANADKADNSGRSARDYAQLDGRNNPVFVQIEAADAEGKGAGSYGPAIH